MKAKEYANKIIEYMPFPHAELDKAMYNVIMDLFAEMVALVKSRHCACDSAFCAVFDEIDNKWIAICNIVNEKLGGLYMKKTGFREVAFSVADKKGMWQLRVVWKPRKISD